LQRTAEKKNPKSGFQTRGIKDVINSMIQLNSSRETNRWNSRDNIILGFNNIKNLEVDLKDSSIYLADEPFNKQAEPGEISRCSMSQAGNNSKKLITIPKKITQLPSDEHSFPNEIPE
jgi:hypothetical protein